MKTAPPFDKAVEDRWSAWVDSLLAKLRELAKPVKAESRYYWNAKDSEHLCEKCAGGDDEPAWDGGGCDSQDYCGKCGVILDHFFTDWGTDEEIGRSADPDEQSQAVSPEEAFTLCNVIDSGCPRLTVRWPDFAYRVALRPELLRIARRVGLLAPGNPDGEESSEATG